MLRKIRAPLQPCGPGENMQYSHHTRGGSPALICSLDPSTLGAVRDRGVERVMRKVGILLASCVWASSAWAGGGVTSVEIVSPGAGECVNNGGEVGTGGILGGEAVQEPRSVPIILRLSDPDGRDLSVTASADGLDLFTSRYRFPAGENLADAEFFIDAFAIEDGERKELEVIVFPVADPNTTARDTVVFQLDRQVPRLTPDEDEFAAVGECEIEAPEVGVVPTDNSDPDPEVEVRVETEGCTRRTIYTVTDTCGNAQEYELVTQTPADPADVQAALVGYECGLEGVCVVRGPDARTFEPDARIGRGTVVLEYDAPAGCINGIETVLMTEEDYVEECPPLEDLPIDDEGFFINPCASLLTGQAIEEPGGYVARIVLSSCGVELVRDELPFTILEPPVADPGGPYMVTQGGVVQLDASGSRVPEELGGAVAYAWDLNGDRFFDSGEMREDLNGNGIQDPFETDRNNNGQWDPPVDLDGDGTIEPREVFPVIDGVIGQVPLETEADGEFVIGLRLTAGNGAEATAEATLTVQDVHPTCLIGGPYQAFEGEVLIFDAGASDAGHPTDPLVAWNWDFGDNRQPQRGDDLASPGHIYREAGEYTVTLRLEDVDSSSECETRVDVQEVEPIVEDIGTLTDEEERIEGEVILMDAGATRPGSDSDPLIEYDWQVRVAGQAGEPLYRQTGRLLRNPEFIFDDQGDYEVCLTATDEDLDATTDCFEISIRDLSPIARCAGPEAAVEGEPLAFSADGSRPGGAADPIVRIEWDFGDDEPPLVVDDFDADAAEEVVHTYRGNGRFVVNMTVFDEDDDASCSFEIDVADTRPTAALEVLYTGGEQTGYEGEPIEFDASDSTPGADAIVAYRWDFGDGGAAVVTDEPRTEHSYAQDGDYQVRVTIVDQDGSTEQAAVVARVANRAPRIELQANEQQFELGQQVQFRTVIDGVVPQNNNPQVAVLVEDVLADLPPNLVEWDFGDGTDPVPGLNPIHRYNAIGEFTITVLVRDEALGGAEAEAEFEVLVTPASPRIDIIEAQRTVEGQELVIEVGVEAPIIGEGPADLAVNVPGLPPGATSEIIEAGADRTVRMTWTPTYYQAGRYTLQVRAEAVGVQDSARTRNVSITVDEGGTPRLAAVGGTAGRGVLTLYDYGLEDFRAVAEVDLGLGVGGLAAQADGRRVFVAVPGSDRVAVVRTAGRLQPTPERRIRVGRRPAAVAAGGAFMWVVNAGSNDMSIIEVETLKLVGTVSLAPLQMPIDVAWLPDGFDGLEGPRLAVIGRRGGRVAIVDPEAALAGEDAVEGVIETGGVLTRVVASPTGWLHVADAKTRRIYRMSAADVAAGRDDADGVPLSFAPHDLAYQGETLYVATGDALLAVSDDGTVEDAPLRVEARALTTADDQILGGGALVVASPLRIENLTPDTLARLRSAGANRVRWLTTFVALD